MKTFKELFLEEGELDDIKQEMFNILKDIQKLFKKANIDTTLNKNITGSPVLNIGKEDSVTVDKEDGVLTGKLEMRYLKTRTEDGGEGKVIKYINSKDIEKFIEKYKTKTL